MSKPYKMKGHELPGPNQRAQPGDSPLEAFSGEAALGGAAKGAVMGASIGGPWGAAIGGVAGGIMGGIKGGKAQEEQEALLEAQNLATEEKDRLAAEALAEKKRSRGNYSGFDAASVGTD